MLTVFSSTVLAQAAPEVVAESPATPPAEAAPSETTKPETPKPETAKPESTPPEPTPPPVPEPFQLPLEQHPWARFQPGAWREVQIVTESFDETGAVVSRNVTIQKDILQAVVEGKKYVLKVQATVDLAGKRIVGDWKDRALHLATDGAGPIAESHRIEDRSLTLAGRDVECQVFEIRYRDGTRNLIDIVHYDPQRFPFVLWRETSVDSGKKETAAETEQLTDVTARELPYQVGEQLLACSWLRTFRHRAKGDKLQMVISNSTVPGGEVAVWSTDFDAQGQRVRWSVTTLLAFGETSPEDADSTADNPADSP